MLAPRKEESVLHRPCMHCAQDGQMESCNQKLLYRDLETTKQKGLKDSVLKKLDIPMENTILKWAELCAESRLLVIVRAFFQGVPASLSLSYTFLTYIS